MKRQTLIRAVVKPPSKLFGNCRTCSKRVPLMAGKSVGHLYEGELCKGSYQKPHLR